MKNLVFTESVFMKKLNVAFLFYLLIIPHSALLAQDFSKKQLEDSPRHHEWVEVDNQGKKIYCFVAFPEKSKSSTLLIVIHENRGLTDWVKSFADQAAAEGYIAVAPDLLSGFSEQFKRTSDFPSGDEARNGISQLKPEQVTSDLNAVEQYATTKIPSGNSEVVVVGFCWGGSQTFRFATNNKKIKAALVFYGSAPKDSTVYGQITAPVYGFYGENDERVNATIKDTERWMKKAAKKYEYEIYTGAGHAYMRQGDDPAGSAENKNARNASWDRIRKILGSL